MQNYHIEIKNIQKKTAPLSNFTSIRRINLNKI